MTTEVPKIFADQVAKAKVENGASKKGADDDAETSSCPLVTIVRAADVKADFKEMAAGWPEWDSETHPQVRLGWERL